MAKKVILLLFISRIALAFNLQTDEIRMQLPEPWTCAPEKQMWICEEKSAARQKSAIILIQTRRAQPKETYSYFRDQLKSPRSIKGRNGPLLSRIVSMQDRVINSQQWFEAIHHEGDLDGYYTHYLATRRGDFSYLITMSAHKGKWETYKTVFQNIVASVVPLVSATPSTPLAAQPQVATTAVASAPIKLVSPLHRPLDLPFPGVTPFRILLLFVFSAIGCVLLYSLRS